MESLEPSACETLDEHGYLVLPDVMGAALLQRLRETVDVLFQQEGERAGSEFKQEPGCRRLANLMNKSDVFREVLCHPVVLGYIRRVLGPGLKLSSMNARRVLPGCLEAQPLHADMAAIPDTRGAWVCNAVWMLDDFTPDNGPLRVVPGTHRKGHLPGDELDDLTVPHPNETIITGRAGTVVIMNAHLWHGGMANRTSQSRTAVHGFFARRDKPQQQYQKGLIDEARQASFSAEIRELLALDDEENDRLSQADVVRSGFMR